MTWNPPNTTQITLLDAKVHHTYQCVFSLRVTFAYRTHRELLLCLEFQQSRVAFISWHFARREKSQLLILQPLQCPHHNPSCPLALKYAPSPRLQRNRQPQTQPQPPDHLAADTRHPMHLRHALPSSCQSPNLIDRVLWPHIFRTLPTTAFFRASSAAAASACSCFTCISAATSTQHPNAPAHTLNAACCSLLLLAAAYCCCLLLLAAACCCLLLLAAASCFLLLLLLLLLLPLKLMTLTCNSPP